MQFTTMFVAAELAAVACAEGLCPASACKQNWKYKGIDQTPCSNPDNDSRGPWCPTALIAGEYVLGSRDYEFCAPCGFVYEDQGKGKCVHLDGSAVTVKSGDWLPGAFSSCRERCNQKHECGGYSLSNKGNCLLYSAPKGQLRVDPDDQWGNSSCNLKLARASAVDATTTTAAIAMLTTSFVASAIRTTSRTTAAAAIASAAEVTTTTAAIAIPTTTTDATTSFVASAIRTTSTTTVAAATASGAEVTATTATIAIPTTTTGATTSSASSAIRTTSTTTVAAEVKEELAIVTLRRMRESFKTGFASHNARPILPALFLALWYFF